MSALTLPARLLSTLLAATLLTGLALSGAHAAPEASLWPRWRTHDPDGAATIDHRPWGRFLDAYRAEGEDGVAGIGYACVSPTDHAALKSYIAGLARVAVSTLNRDEQRAYWINLYNALTVDLVLDHRPVASIRDIDFTNPVIGLFAPGPWDEPLVAVEGETLSLNDIEHRILRPIWGDPRLHYALNCAAKGCPEIAPRPFTAANAEAMLDAAAKRFVNDHPGGVRVDGAELKVSQLYLWYRADFAEDGAGQDEARQGAGLFRHIRRYAAPALAERMTGLTGISSQGYDWGLNAVSCAPH